MLPVLVWEEGEDPNPPPEDDVLLVFFLACRDVSFLWCSTVFVKVSAEATSSVLLCGMMDEGANALLPVANEKNKTVASFILIYFWNVYDLLLFTTLSVETLELECMDNCSFGMCLLFSFFLWFEKENNGRQTY